MKQADIEKEIKKTNRKVNKLRQGLVNKIHSFIRDKARVINETDSAILGLQDKRRADQEDIDKAMEKLEEARGI